jgi:hypothetical protein
MQGLCGLGELTAMRHRPEIAQMVEVQLSHFRLNQFDCLIKSNKLCTNMNWT